MPQCVEPSLQAFDRWGGEVSGERYAIRPGSLEQAWLCGVDNDTVGVLVVGMYRMRAK